MRKIVISIIGIVCLLLIVFLVKDLNRHPSVIVGYKTPAPSSFASSIAYSNDSLVYSDGSALELFNYKTNQSTVIGPVNTGLGTIDSLSISADGHYLLFHDQQVNNGGLLASELQSKGLDSTLDYWWLYSFSSSSFESLPQNVVLAKFANNGLVDVLEENSGAESIVSFNASNLSQTASINVSGSSNFFPDQNGFLLQTTGNKVLFTQNGLVNQLLYNSATIVGVLPNQQLAIGTLSHNNDRQLAIFNLSKQTASVIANNLVNAPLLQGNSVLYTTGSGSNLTNSEHIYSYNQSTHTNYSWQLNKIGSISSINLITFLNPTTALVSDSSSNYFIIGS